MSDESSTPAGTGRSASLLFVVSSFVVLLSFAVGRPASALVPEPWQDLARQLIDAGILFVSFYGLARSGIPDLRPMSSVGFVRRPGIAAEFGRGAALGWGIAVAMLVPALLLRDLRLTFTLNFVSLVHLGTGVLTLIGFALVVQLILSGLPMRLLVRAIGPGRATVGALLLASILLLAGVAGEGSSLIFGVLLMALFVTAFLRTRAIWLPLGLQLGLTISLQLLFGIASPYTPATDGIARGETAGPAWLTGGAFGPEASLFGIAVLVAALAVLFRLTRDYAWHYTYQPITGAGYAMDVPPPPQHAQEEQRAAPLVQIVGLPSGRQEPPAGPLG